MQGLGRGRQMRLADWCMVVCHAPDSCMLACGALIRVEGCRSCAQTGPRLASACKTPASCGTAAAPRARSAPCRPRPRQGGAVWRGQTLVGTLRASAPLLPLGLLPV